MKLSELGILLDNDGDRSHCTWNNDRFCGTHCLHFKLVDMNKITELEQVKVKKVKVASLLCSPQYVEIPLEE